MRKFRSNRHSCGFLLAVLLLSVVFCETASAWEEVASFARYERRAAMEADAEADAVICPPGLQRGKSRGADYISPVRLLTGQAVAGRQSGLRVWWLRVLVIAWALYVILSSRWRLILRNYGCRKIALWKSIYYIHRSDGEKGMLPVYGY